MFFVYRIRCLERRQALNSLWRGITILAMIVAASTAYGNEDAVVETGIIDPGPAIPGSRAPDFRLRDLDQNPVRLSEFRGKPVVLNFFASWCGPCLQELPIIQEAYLEYGNQEFAILGIGYQDSRWAIESLAEDLELTFPIVIDGDNSVGRAYRVIGPPYTFFIDAKGFVVAVVPGAIERETLHKNLGALMENAATILFNNAIESTSYKLANNGKPGEL